MYTRLIFTRGLKEAFVLHFQFVLRSAGWVFGVGCELFSSKFLENPVKNGVPRELTDLRQRLPPGRELTDLRQQ